MTDITAGDGVEGWLKRADRDLRALKTAVGRARVPRVCTSTTRPDPRSYQPGVGIFEMDTGYWLMVNATQDGYLEYRKYVAPPAPPVVPAHVDGTGGITYPTGVASRSGSNKVGRTGVETTYNLQLITSAALAGDAVLCTIPDGFRPATAVLVEGPVFVLTSTFTAAGVAHVYFDTSGNGQVKFGRMLPVGGGASTTALASGSILTATFSYSTT